MENAVVISFGAVVLANQAYKSAEKARDNAVRLMPTPSYTGTPMSPGEYEYYKQREKDWIEMQKAQGNIPDAPKYQ